MNDAIRSIGHSSPHSDVPDTYTDETTLAFEQSVEEHVHRQPCRFYKMLLTDAQVQKLAAHKTALKKTYITLLR